MATIQVTPFQLTDQFTMDNFNERINETNTALGNINTALSERPNPNLLDNWYFGNPVNQRGISSQNPWPSNAYGIDRWILYGSNASLENGYIYFPAGVVPTQVLDTGLYNSLAGKVATLSYLMNDGNLVTGTATITKGTTTLFVNNSEGQSYINGSGGLQFYRNAGFGCIAIKLELGSQQTLAHQENGNWVLNEIPDYTTEYLKCKRYYRRCGIGLYVTTQAPDTFIITFPFDVPMRTAPVAKFIRTNFKLYSAMAANPSITVTDPNITVKQLYEKGVRAIGFKATLSAAFENKMLYRFNSDYDIIELSADL